MSVPISPEMAGRLQGRFLGDATITAAILDRLAMHVSDPEKARRFGEGPSPDDRMLHHSGAWASNAWG
jgi:hypothetical protein